MTAAALLPALRRPPSQPPATPTALPQVSSAALDPQSTAVTAILAAADPRLAGVLSQAVGQQAVAAALATASVIALRTKANPPADVHVESNTQLPLSGTADSLVAGSWFVTEQNIPNGTPTVTTFANRIHSVEQYSRNLNLPEPAPPTYVPTTTVTLSGVAWQGNGSQPFDQITA